MTRQVLFDSDVMIDFLRGVPAAVKIVTGQSHQALLSSITVAELYAGVRSEDERSDLDGLINFFRVIPVSAEIARRAGLLKKQYGRSHGVGLADAVIAATAEIENARLITLHIRHFPMIRGLKPPYRKSR